MLEIKRTAIKPIIDSETINSIIEIREPYKKYKDKIIDILATSNALLRGHFSLLSGMHSDIFLRFNNVCSFSENLEFIANLLVEQLKGDYDVVISPDTSGVLLAYEIAKKMGLKRVTARTNEKNIPTDLINYVDLKPKAKVLVVNDMTTTTEGLRNLIQLIQKYDAIPVEIALFAIRDEKEKPAILELTNKYKMSAIIDLKVNAHEYKDNNVCPICKATNKEDIPVESWKLN